MLCYAGPMSRQGVVLVLLVIGGAASADSLPTGYLVWTRGKAGDASSRAIHRLTLPGKTDEKVLTGGEDVECQVSPDGKWVAYAKAKLGGGSDYHNFKLWKVYIVSIHGVGQGREEIKIDDDGAWPSWGKDSDVLFYNQPDGTHTRIIRVELDDYGQVKEKKVFFATKSAFASFSEVNECFVAPDASWFAARTRGAPSVNGVGAYQVSPAKHLMLARAGSIGCMPYVAPSGTWGLIASATEGIRWGHGPQVADRKEDQQLVPPLSASHKAYHPGISTDEKWVLAGMGTEQEHNAGHYDVYIYPLDTATMKAGAGQALASGEFNGWPHVWVGTPSPPPPPEPHVVDFYPSSYTVAPGDAVTLTWSTFQADQVELDGSPVASDGTQQVTPPSTTDYTLVARSSAAPGASDSASCKVTVNTTPRAVVIESFKAAPEAIEQGQSATLSWTVSNPTTLEVDGQRAAPTGSLEVSPLETTTYRLTAQGLQGPVTAEATVTVEEISSGLLPDKGGFVCSVAGDGDALLPLVLLLVALVIRRRRR